MHNEQNHDFSAPEVHQPHTLGKSNKASITIRLDSNTIEYFKKLAEQTSLPYQTLINSYLSDCAKKKKELNFSWT